MAEPEAAATGAGGSPLAALLVVQEHDLAADRLRHRRETLPERAALAAAEAAATAAAGERQAVEGRRADVDTQERRLADEVSSISGKAADVERTLYSGEVSSPRELQAMQADVEQLRAQQRKLEDRELELMESREQLDGELRAIDTALAGHGEEIERQRDAVAAQERAIDAEIDVELRTRAEAAAGLGADLLTTYEGIRAKGGVGAARLTGMSCQACHLTIPSTEVDTMRRAAHAGTADTSLHLCDNCGAILVLT